MDCRETNPLKIQTRHVHNQKWSQSRLDLQSVYVKLPRVVSTSNLARLKMKRKTKRKRMRSSRAATVKMPQMKEKRKRLKRRNLKRPALMKRKKKILLLITMRPLILTRLELALRVEKRQ
jgi:hypothetical protein